MSQVVIDDRTANRNLPKPHQNNNPFEVDVPRMRDALDQLDTDIQDLVDRDELVTVTDWHAINATGFYEGTDAANAPVSGRLRGVADLDAATGKLFLTVRAIDTGDLTDSTVFEAQFFGGSWGDWQQLITLKSAVEAIAKAEAISYTDTALAALVDSSPAALDTLDELAAALGDDPNFATTVLNQLSDRHTKTESDLRFVRPNVSTNYTVNQYFDTDRALIFGNALQMWRNALNSHLESSEGDFYIINRADGKNVYLGAEVSTDAYYHCGVFGEGMARLYRDGVERLRTDATGVDVTGNVLVNGSFPGMDLRAASGSFPWIDLTGDGRSVDYDWRTWISTDGLYYNISYGGSGGTGAGYKFQISASGTLWSIGYGHLHEYFALKSEAGGGFTTQYFTSSGIWTKPAGLKAAKVTVVGGGGGGTQSGSGGFTGGNSTFKGMTGFGGLGYDTALGGIATGGDINLTGQRGSGDLTGGLSGLGTKTYGGGGDSSGYIGGGGAGVAIKTYQANELAASEVVTVGAGGSGVYTTGGGGLVIIEEFF